jgi:hypothetical protein
MWAFMVPARWSGFWGCTMPFTWLRLLAIVLIAIGMLLPQAQRG